MQFHTMPQLLAQQALLPAKSEYIRAHSNAATTPKSIKLYRHRSTSQHFSALPIQHNHHEKQEALAHPIHKELTEDTHSHPGTHLPDPTHATPL
jgi:hypothetical protein